jgi:hypothetical protein
MAEVSGNDDFVPGNAAISPDLAIEMHHRTFV